MQPNSHDSFHQKVKEDIRDYAISLGFAVCGFARIERVDSIATTRYAKWLHEGKHDEMQYLERYLDIKEHPALLLDGAKSIICVALNYFPQVFQSSEAPQFAYYAYGKDYHEVVRQKLLLLSQYITEHFESTSRVCVDTAPIRERYWAQKSGIGFVGRNNQLIIPGKGSYFFLGELVTTIELPPDLPCTISCGDCGRCVTACPVHALDEKTALDARKCLSCLTIEHKGDLPENVDFGNHLYGCDECQKACPHNNNASPSTVVEFQPSPQFLNLTYKDIKEMDNLHFNALFRHSAVKRAKLAMLQRTIGKLSHPTDKK